MSVSDQQTEAGAGTGGEVAVGNLQDLGVDVDRVELELAVEGEYGMNEGAAAETDEKRPLWPLGDEPTG